MAADAVALLVKNAKSSAEGEVADGIVGEWSSLFKVENNFLVFLLFAIIKTLSYP